MSLDKGAFVRYLTRVQQAGDSKRRRRAGQIMVEYAIVAGILTSLVVMMAVLLVVFKENGARVLDLIASDSP
jgi:hypothetical protein